jgi:hypothetical protein
VVGAAARTAEYSTCHATQQEVDRAHQFRYPIDRGATGLGNLPQRAGPAEPARVHGGGKRLEVRLSRQVCIQVVELPCGIEK